MRRWLWAVVIVVLAPACGGGGSDGVIDVTVDDVEVIIDDVVVTLEVPDGAVPAGTEIGIKAGSVPAELAEVSDVTVYAFDLEPSGLEFSEPATITFRLAAPGETGTPLAYVVIEDSDGTATLLSAETIRHGDEVQVTALVDHFSLAYLVLPNGREVILTPPLLEMGVGETKRSVMELAGPTDESFSNDNLHDHWDTDDEQRDDDDANAIVRPKVLPVGSGFITVAYVWFGNVDVTCLKETDGVIEDAYEVVLIDQDFWRVRLDSIFQVLVGPVTGGWTLRFLGDVKCNAADSGPSTGDEDPTDEDPTDGEPEETEPELDTSEIEAPETIDFTLDLSGGSCSQYASEYSQGMEMTADPAPAAGEWILWMVNPESGQEVHSVPWDPSSGEPVVLVFVGEYSDKYEFNPETGTVDYFYVDVNSLECFWQGAILAPQDLEDFDIFMGALGFLPSG